MNTQEQVMDALRQVMHPELERDLVELGMIEDVVVQDSQVAVVLALPFIEVPIKDDLVRAIQEAVQAIDPALQVQVQPVEMSQRERAAFMAQSDNREMPGRRRLPTTSHMSWPCSAARAAWASRLWRRCWPWPCAAEENAWACSMRTLPGPAFP